MIVYSVSGPMASSSDASLPGDERSCDGAVAWPLTETMLAVYFLSILERRPPLAPTSSRAVTLRPMPATARRLCVRESGPVTM